MILRCCRVASVTISLVYEVTSTVILALVGLSIYSLVAYRNELKPLGGNVSPQLDDLKQRVQIAEPDQSQKPLLGLDKALVLAPA